MEIWLILAMLFICLLVVLFPVAVGMTLIETYRKLRARSQP